MADVGAGVDVVTGVAFNAAGQVTAMTYGAQGLTVAETRSYNVLGQLTRFGASGLAMCQVTSGHILLIRRLG
jgi:YD repeat-containing protein